MQSNYSDTARMRRLTPSVRKGLVVVITGEGKGKTSSSLGMALRAYGHGQKVCIIQFMKGDLYSGEWDAIRQLQPGIELYATGKGFSSSYGEHKISVKEALDLAEEKMVSGEYGLIILDEINNALHLKMVTLERVIELINRKPEMTHLILTGRNASEEVIALADTVSEVREIKHAYRSGIEPQPGIEY